MFFGIHVSLVRSWGQERFSPPTHVNSSRHLTWSQSYTQHVNQTGLGWIIVIILHPSDFSKTLNPLKFPWLSRMSKAKRSKRAPARLPIDEPGQSLSITDILSSFGYRIDGLRHRKNQSHPVYLCIPENADNTEKTDICIGAILAQWLEILNRKTGSTGWSSFTRAALSEPTNRKKGWKLQSVGRLDDDVLDKKVM